MKEKVTIILVLAFTIIVLVIAWFWLQDIIVKYDIDRAITTNEFIRNGALSQAKISL